MLGNRNWPQDSDGYDIGECRLLEEFSSLPRGEWTRGSAERPGSECRAVTWSDDGQWFGWSCGQRIVRLVQWNKNVNRALVSEDDGNPYTDFTTEINTGDLVFSMAFGTKRLNSTTKSPSSTNDNKISIWSGNVVTNGQSSICSKELTPGEVVVATGQSNGRIRIWNIRTGQLKFELCDHVTQIESLHFAPTGKFLLVSVAADGTLKIWDMDDGGNMIRTLKTVRGSFRDCRWAPDCKTLATVGDLKSVCLWDMVKYELIRKLDGHHHNVTRCEYSPDGAVLATSSFDTRVILWDPSTGLKLTELNHCSPPPSLMYAGGANGSFVRGLSFSKDGLQISTVCDDGYMRVWNISAPDAPVQVAPVRNGLTVQFSPSGSAIAVGNAKGCCTVYQVAPTVPALQQMCRSVIRRCIGDSNLIGSLADTVPPSILRYLRYIPNWRVYIEP